MSYVRKFCGVQFLDVQFCPKNTRITFDEPILKVYASYNKKE